MMIVLDTLSPAERVAFVLHDLFAFPISVNIGAIYVDGRRSRRGGSRAVARSTSKSRGEREGISPQREVARPS